MEKMEGDGSGWLKCGNPGAENRLVPAELDLRLG